MKNPIFISFIIMEQQVLVEDEEFVNYLLKNEDIIRKCFKVPEDKSPSTFLVSLAYESNTKSLMSKEYSSASLYATKKTCCSFCAKKLKVKKKLNVNVYDDIFGTTSIIILSKYCKSCKLTYYPGYAEDYNAKIRYFDDNWNSYGIFVSTFCTAFSNDFLDRCICLKQKCHTTFMGRTQAYNMQHKYRVPSDKVLDKRRLSEAYYKYTLILFKERYGLSLQIKGSINDALKSDYNTLYEQFKNKFSNHICDVNGCVSCLVVDGHMKAHRKICKEKGCVDDPKFQSIFCKLHSYKDSRSLDDDNVQELLNENEYHIEKIVQKSFDKKLSKWFYKVLWKGYAEMTMEPKENIPRILVELFERYGDSTANIEIINYFESNGIKYVIIKVNDETLCLPACALEVSEEAYLIHTPDTDSCNTEKTKSRFYQRIGYR